MLPLWKYPCSLVANGASDGASGDRAQAVPTMLATVKAATVTPRRLVGICTTTPVFARLLLAELLIG